MPRHRAAPTPMPHGIVRTALRCRPLSGAARARPCGPRLPALAAAWVPALPATAPASRPAA
jgi:hypothetical protein